MIGYIYKLICPITFEVKYIGLTEHPDKRKIEHRCYRQKGNYKMSQYKKYLKENNVRFIFEIIEECSTSEMSNREMFWITQYDNLLNLTEGGEHNLISDNHNSKKLKGNTLESYYGVDRAEGIKRKISNSLKGETNPNYNGKYCTKEWKSNQVISQSKTPLVVYDENRNFIGEFINSKECARHLECGHANN